MSNTTEPFTFVTFGPDANCTLDLCPVEWSVYQYRPSLPVNIVFIALFVLAMAAHTYLGIIWKSWFFMGFMIAGCVIEIIGYVGRILMYYNPWDFAGFMTQIVFITIGPVFYTAAIYVTLSKTIEVLAPELSWVNPKFFYWIFIPADLICLVLQAAGGALSTVSSGSSDTGVNIAMGGLILQVVVLAIFTTALVDYIVRYYRSGAKGASTKKTRMYFGGLFTAIILILARCIYRCYELSQGYQDSNLITDQGLFIGLEGVPIILAAFSLCIGHPGLLLSDKGRKSLSSRTSDEEAVTEAKHGAFTHGTA